MQIFLKNAHKEFWLFKCCTYQKYKRFIIEDKSLIKAAYPAWEGVRVESRLLEKFVQLSTNVQVILLTKGTGTGK